VVAIVFVIGIRLQVNQPVATGSSSASPTATASASPSASGLASPTATAVASQGAGLPATVVASVPNCEHFRLLGQPARFLSSRAATMFMSAHFPTPGGNSSRAMNLTTNKVVQTYPAYPAYDTNVLRGFAVAGGALWVQNDNGSGCSQSQSCTGFYHVLRVDLVSGIVTRDLVDTILIGVRPGYVLAGDISQGMT